MRLLGATVYVRPFLRVALFFTAYFCAPFCHYGANFLCDLPVYIRVHHFLRPFQIQRTFFVGKFRTKTHPVHF